MKERLFLKNWKIMVVNDIKPLVKGIALLQYIMAGGIAVYHIVAIDNKKSYL